MFTSRIAKIRTLVEESKSLTDDQEARKDWIKSNQQIKDEYQKLNMEAMELITIIDSIKNITISWSYLSPDLKDTIRIFVDDLKTFVSNDESIPSEEAPPFVNEQHQWISNIVKSIPSQDEVNLESGPECSLIDLIKASPSFGLPITSE